MEACSGDSLALSVMLWLFVYCLVAVVAGGTVFLGRLLFLWFTGRRPPSGW
jgi:hypothetical protein